jgi:hypothetical protein
MSTSESERAPLCVVKTPVRNRRKSAVMLRIEPWGEAYELPPGATVQVLARGPEGDTIDIEWRSDAVTVYGWPGSTVSVLRKGVDVGAPPGETKRERLTAPYLPEGMRVREWLAAMAS